MAKSPSIGVQDGLQIDARSETTLPSDSFANEVNASSITSFNASRSRYSRLYHAKLSGQHQHHDKISNNAGTSASDRILLDLDLMTADVRRWPLQWETLVAIHEKLTTVLKYVEHRLDHPAPAGMGGTVADDDELDQEEPDLIPRSYTHVLDEYLSCVGDLDLAKERWETFVLDLREREDRLERFGPATNAVKEERRRADQEEARELVKEIQTAFEQVKEWEKKCVAENSLSEERDDPNAIVLDIDGSQEQRFFLMPSEHWHDRRDAHEFEIIPLVPSPPPPPPPLPISGFPRVVSKSISSKIPSNSVVSEILAALQHALSHSFNAEDLQTDTHPRLMTYEVCWEVPTFFQAHCPTGSLGTLLTVTGNVVDAYASSCQDYVAEFFGPPGTLLLRAVEALLSGNHAGAFRFLYLFLKVDSEYTPAIAQNIY